MSPQIRASPTPRHAVLYRECDITARSLVVNTAGRLPTDPEAGVFSPLRRTAGADMWRALASGRTIADRVLPPWWITLRAKTGSVSSWWFLRVDLRASRVDRY